MHRTLHPGSVTDQKVSAYIRVGRMSSLTLFSRCPMPSGRSERASVITFSVLARKSESGAVSCSVLAGFGFLSYTAFEVLERNLLVSSGPQEHGTPTGDGRDTRRNTAKS